MENNSNVIVWVLVIGIIFSVINANNQAQKTNELRAVISDLEMLIEECSDTIDEANNYIEEARWYAWEDYYSMGDALENLQPVDSNCYSY